MGCKTMTTHISDRNSKLGKVPNVSLPPIASCRKDAPCKKECYALKAYRMYPNVKTAWNDNLEMVQNNYTQYWTDIADYLSSKRKPVPFFRWHVSGDIIDTEYLYEMCAIATMFPDTTFLAFTKQYDIVNSYPYDIPDNLTIIFSAWPGLEMDNPNNYPVAWYQDGTETRIPAEHLRCPGNCETCGMCFNIKKTGLDVVFNKH